MSVSGSNLEVVQRLVYSSMEECCATNAVIRVRILLSQQKIKLRLGVMATCRSHKPENTSSSLVVATKDDLTQLAECYPDTIVVKGSSPLVITKLVRNSIGFRVPVFYTGSCEFESHRANKK